MYFMLALEISEIFKLFLLLTLCKSYGILREAFFEPASSVKVRENCYSVR